MVRHQSLTKCKVEEEDDEKKTKSKHLLRSLALYDLAKTLYGNVERARTCKREFTI